MLTVILRVIVFKRFYESFLGKQTRFRSGVYIFALMLQLPALLPLGLVARHQEEGRTARSFAAAAVGVLVVG